jgi:hypothetical protein
MDAFLLYIESLFFLSRFFFNELLWKNPFECILLHNTFPSTKVFLFYTFTLLMFKKPNKTIKATWMHFYCTLRAYFFYLDFFLMNCFGKIPFRKMHSVIMYMQLFLYRMGSKEAISNVLKVLFILHHPNFKVIVGSNIILFVYLTILLLYKLDTLLLKQNKAARTGNEGFSFQYFVLG